MELGETKSLGVFLLRSKSSAIAPESRSASHTIDVRLTSKKNGGVDSSDYWQICWLVTSVFLLRVFLKPC